MTLTKNMEDALTSAGIAHTLREAADGSPQFTVCADVHVEVMLDLVALGGKPYVVFHPGLASPHMDTPDEVVAYLRGKDLL